MSASSTNKNLVFVIIVLLLTNIAVLVYFLWLKKPDEHMAGRDGDRRSGIMMEMLEKEVGFNAEQIAQYKTLKDEQRETIRPMFDEMRKAKDSLFKLLMAPAPVADSTVSEAAGVIGEKQRALDFQTYQHFKKVRALCSSPEQTVKYDSAVIRMFRKMGRPQKKAEGDKEQHK